MADNGSETKSGAKGPAYTPKTEKPRNRRKTRIGYVVSDKMQKTIVVELEDRKSHPLYGKIIRTTTKVKAHDEDGVAGVGDDPEGAEVLEAVSREAHTLVGLAGSVTLGTGVLLGGQSAVRDHVTVAAEVQPDRRQEGRQLRSHDQQGGRLREPHQHRRAHQVEHPGKAARAQEIRLDSMRHYIDKHHPRLRGPSRLEALDRGRSA